MAIDYKKLGLRISKFRADKGFSQEAFASMVRSSRKHISLIETGSSAPSLDLLFDIANTLEVTIDDLLIDSLQPSTEAIEIRKLLSDCNRTEAKVLTKTAKQLKAILVDQGI